MELFSRMTRTRRAGIRFRKSLNTNTQVVTSEGLQVNISLNYGCTLTHQSATYLDATMCPFGV
ncbi:hypothetical protein M404DRAFT_995391 [Pisolithus tinctorius Marx 270]|uniref:Uncharacterized protein n=1 Tax=Pisolithus tinctorius Marx 270 TaxID=870435 RepID=A0A0C3PBB3_PISTI|nr:hypothetical protein M404DRAFT_995391 [Pisolithus tinctorius Marx 270]